MRLRPKDLRSPVGDHTIWAGVGATNAAKPGALSTDAGQVTCCGETFSGRASDERIGPNTGCLLLDQHTILFGKTRTQILKPVIMGKEIGFKAGVSRNVRLCSDKMRKGDHHVRKCTNRRSDRT